jgi:hypothetical protein
VAVACYGNFRRDQTHLERGLWGVISLAGYAALMDRGTTSNLVFGATWPATSTPPQIRPRADDLKRAIGPPAETAAA